MDDSGPNFCGTALCVSSSEANSGSGAFSAVRGTCAGGNAIFLDHLDWHLDALLVLAQPHVAAILDLKSAPADLARSRARLGWGYAYLCRHLSLLRYH